MQASHLRSIIKSSHILHYLTSCSGRTPSPTLPHQLSWKHSHLTSCPGRTPSPTLPHQFSWKLTLWRSWTVQHRPDQSDYVLKLDISEAASQVCTCITFTPFCLSQKLLLRALLEKPSAHPRDPVPQKWGGIHDSCSSGEMSYIKETGRTCMDL